jgi:hypothetical protein
MCGLQAAGWYNRKTIVLVKTIRRITLLQLLPLLLCAEAVIAQPVEVFPAKNLYTVKGRLTDKSTNTPAPGRQAYLSVPGSVFEFRMATSDSAGNVVFLVKNLESSKQVIFQTDYIADSNLTLQLTTPLIEKFEADKYPSRIKIVGDTLPFFGKADKEYLLDDYVRFPTMEEVLREYVLEVKVRKSRERFRLEVYNLPYRLFFDAAPLVLLDGIPLFDTNALMAIDPLKIKSIHVVARKYYFGPAVINGIVSLSSYDGNLAGYQLPVEAQVRDVNAADLIK